MTDGEDFSVIANQQRDGLKKCMGRILHCSGSFHFFPILNFSRLVWLSDFTKFFVTSTVQFLQYIFVLVQFENLKIYNKSLLLQGPVQTSNFSCA